ncbi:MAG: hypothetical protein PVG39_25860 [Desulfobacteraceae bacterium]|jgi:hypothetical protein
MLDIIGAISIVIATAVIMWSVVGLFIMANMDAEVDVVHWRAIAIIIGCGPIVWLCTLYVLATAIGSKILRMCFSSVLPRLNTWVAKERK